MFKKILIANRGEIALRIIRACKELGISTVAVYSEADADSLHVRFADEAVCIGPPPSHQSYLNIPRIISAAEITGADAIHPGYGFLAENAHFADITESCDIRFIGPPAGVIDQMGNKALAKATMKKAGVPIIPGSEGIVESVNQAKKLAKSFGFPVILKASAGGGGKGMRIVRNEDEIEMAFQTAQTEAGAAFGNPDLYLEKFLENPRHIEIQIIGDDYGNIITLGERECSIQRKHQKLIEEAPSPAVDEKTRKAISKTALNGAKAAGYRSAGTIEFLLNEDGKFYFMEVNTRIQVEHPVTEQVFGLDLLQEQIKVAAGEKLSPKKDLKMRGHAMECRINAENPDKNFMPSPGKITDFHTPGGFGVRVDTHAYAQYSIPPYYDSLIAKTIVHGKTREEVIKRMTRALEEFVIEGVHTTIPLHLKILQDENFRAGNFTINFMESFLGEK
ncbi:MAG TPA: acetyl-CoA carboxylase biotin carboxylase subunit [Bacteroidetes bacterium]|nr:acetyl-CoA carboxylase biotin carboxylase subunit [Bacteroidota bacterium]